MTNQSPAFLPFADDAAVCSLGDDFTIENHQDRIEAFGNLVLRRDLRGLERARILADLFARAVSILEKDASHLPEIASVQATSEGDDTVGNPFG